MSRRLPRRPSAHALALTGLVLVVALVVFLFSLDYGLRENDEGIAIFGGRWYAREPGDLLDLAGYGGRGPERLTAVLYLIADQLTGSTQATFTLAHAMQALGFAVAGLPVYVLCRELDVPRAGALLAGALTVICPWAILGITFLNSSLGYATAALMLLLGYRAAVRPSARNDLAFLAAVVLAALARVGHAPLALAIVPGILAADLGARRVGVPWLRHLGGLPRRVAVAHPILVGAGVLAVALVAVKGQTSLFGSSYAKGIATQGMDWDRFWTHSWQIIGRASVGMGLLPAMLAGPWLVREAFRPRRPESGVFAWMTIGWIAVLLYVLLTAAIEDRYIMPLVPVTLVAFACAVFRREATWWAVLIGGLVIARAAAVGLYSSDEPFSFLVGGSTQPFRRVVLGRFRENIHLVPGDWALTVVLLIAVGVAVALALRYRFRGRMPTVIAATACAGLFAYGGIGAVYDIDKFLDQTEANKQSLHDWTFADRHARGAPVAFISEVPNGDPTGPIDLLDLSFFNADVRDSVTTGGPVMITPPIGIYTWTAPPDPATGVLAPTEPALDRWIVGRAGFFPYSLAATTVEDGPHGLRLFKLDPGAPRLTTQITGASKTGWGVPGRPTRVRAYPGGAGRCLTGTIVAPPTGPRSRFTLRGSEGAARGTLAPGASERVKIPLAATTIDHLVLRGAPKALDDKGRPATASLQDVDVDPC